MENKGNNNGGGKNSGGGGNNKNGMTVLMFCLTALLVLFLVSTMMSVCWPFWMSIRYSMAEP